MQPITNVTLPTLKVLRALELGDTYGFAIMERTGLKSGSLYPILNRLEALGWITGEWETPHPQGRPPRRYYELVPEARVATTRLLRERSVSLGAIGDRFRSDRNANL